ncbi:TetR/AcrR family transcriptional regulator [Alicyclobacillus dauci]|uniref:TetR/AcrR family transcriptional regulator n=1 Tax=Alicyclobacillus dauci TaxID=1475485 RepID=A0ABY6Z8B7_9BACL|nr:TetR/AcrR family transcriptional regulator [Alicyclobacillus dauci]WAH38778.1 TetR/AcrR family transcriptional regulator [Alicyclobacillus dauci]
MPRTERQNQQIRDERREQILQAALKVFARRGLAATKMTDISEEAGLSKGLAYHYFHSKEEIFTTLVKKATESSKLVLHYAKQQAGSPLEQIHWMTRMILQSIEGEGGYLFLTMIHAYTSDAVPEEVRELLTEEHTSSQVKESALLISAGQDQGEIVAGDPEKLAVAYYSLIEGLAISKLQWEDCPIPDAEMILRIFKANQA